MNQHDVALALKKQRLQLRSEQLRRQAAGHVAGIAPALDAAGRIRQAAAWLRAHPLVPVAALVALLVARPRRALRWGRRAVVVWSLIKRAGEWFSTAPAKDHDAATAGR